MTDERHGGNVWQGGRPGDWLDFSASLRPEGPPEWAMQAMREGLSQARYYPDREMRRAREALAEYPGGLMIGGGVTSENAAHFLDMGASHVIVTSYVFRNGRVDWKRLERLVREVGTEHLVLDLSCRRTEQGYCIATDRWQKLTEVYITPETLDLLKESCAEYLIHAVDAEGKRRGIEEPLAKLLGDWGKIPVTYAGGVGSFRDLDILREAGSGRLDVTIGSALSIFGGDMELAEVIRYTVSNE